MSERKNNDRANFIIGLVAVIIIGVVVTVNVIRGNLEKQNKTKQEETVVLTSNDVENYCQDANLIGKYIDLSKINIYRVLDQNEKTYENYYDYVDSDGNKIWENSWNGKYKDTGNSIRFNCWVSGKNKDTIKLHYLEIDGMSLYDTRSSTVYDADKELVFAEKSDEERLDALRKCTVMEAADIYNTGIGGNKNTAFDDAKNTCERNYESWSKKDFHDAVYEDWENRKNEVIEGKNLEYYLNVLGW